MNESKTEKPTKRKLKKARERGEVAKSSFFAGALLFSGGVLLIWAMSPFLKSRFQASMREGLIALRDPKIEGALQRVISPLVFPIAAILLVVLALSIGSYLFQTGWVVSFERIKPKWRKKKGEKRLILPLMQIAGIALIGYFAIGKKFDPNLLFHSPETQSAFFFKKIIFLSIELGAFLLFLGLCDFFYQKWRYNKQMQMTPEEKKEEVKESEGDPGIKERMRRRRD